MIQQVNPFLRQIHAPTWLRRPIKEIGQQGHGALKADEWRSLLTIQLPLILIILWTGSNQTEAALLHNFAHLVCLTNIVLKRKMTMAHINQYRYHLHKYLESSLQLFQHCSLTPNHHMAIHLADLLEKLGPVRSWWAYPFERQMGEILLACNNNHPSQFLLPQLSAIFFLMFPAFLAQTKCRSHLLHALVVWEIWLH